MVMTQGELDQLPVTPAQFTLGQTSIWWREGETVVRYTGRWSLYGDEVEIRKIAVKS